MSSAPTKKISKKKVSLGDPNEGPKKLSLFDHVKHIRQVQDPNYYINLPVYDQKTFNHFMILRALAMDDSLVEDIAQLYPIFDKIPSPQFYQLLITLVPKSNRFYPWIKSRSMKHNKELLGYVAKRFGIPQYQASEYINLLLRNNTGQEELVSICKSFGLEDGEIEEIFEKKKDE